MQFGYERDLNSDEKKLWERKERLINCGIKWGGESASVPIKWEGETGWQ